LRRIKSTGLNCIDAVPLTLALSLREREPIEHGLAPLTLALSLREREPIERGLAFPLSLRERELIERGLAFPPLPFRPGTGLLFPLSWGRGPG